MLKSYHKLINYHSIGLLGVLGMSLYEWVLRRTQESTGLRTSGENFDQVEVVKQTIPESFTLKVNRGEGFIVQSNLETRGDAM